MIIMNAAFRASLIPGGLFIGLVDADQPNSIVAQSDDDGPAVTFEQMGQELLDYADTGLIPDVAVLDIADELEKLVAHLRNTVAEQYRLVDEVAA